jgi:glutamate-1-semialdehyde 2,1-aminomutase
MEQVMNKKSKALFQRAIKSIPGGVNSPVRAGKAVGVDPLFISRAEGCQLWDADGNSYIDYVCSWGPMILGHGHPEVLKAIEERLAKGTSYGAPTELEVEMAETIIEMVPSIEMVRMVNSGTEAAMSAVRLARGFTGRDKIIKFDGCYHGHSDCLLVSAGSGVATLGIPWSPGIPQDLASHTISLPFNSLDSVAAAFERYSNGIAAVIVEPVPGNMGVVLPDRAFLAGLREITTDKGALLIFDEVITGFRIGPGGAQKFYGITPDLTCLGKIIGGGLPVGAFGGRRDIMERMAPSGDIYQAGTLSGNPLAMAAGLTTLKMLKDEDIYSSLEEKGQALFSGIQSAARMTGQDVTINRIGSMGTIFFTSAPVKDYESAKKADSDKYARFYRAMLQRGIYLAPSAFEAAFVSTTHDKESILKTIECAAESMKTL